MKAWLRNLSWWQLLAMTGLIAIGTLAIWSAGGARSEAVFHGMWKQNLWMAAVGLVVYFALSSVDYRAMLTVGAIPAYVVALILLVAVLLFGSTVYGGRRWLWFFQPSEVAKLGVIVALAQIFGSDAAKDSANWRRGFRGFALGWGLAGLALVLILLEPDLGTTLVLVPAVLVMMLSAKVWRRGTVAIVALWAIVVALMLGAVNEAEKPGVSAERREAILKWVPLRAHQLRRVKVFMYPENDTAGAGYNLRQSKISIGSGGVRGKGLRKGENNHLKYLPQAISMNDFIFCVWAEETGFVGSVVMLALYAVLLVSCMVTAYRTEDGRGRLLALGVGTLVFAHVFINIAMSVGMVPITGLPLPFISSGRTFLMVMMVALGLVQSVNEKARVTNYEL